MRALRYGDLRHAAVDRHHPDPASGRDLDLAKLPRLVVSPQTARESQAVLTAFIRHHLGRDLKSMQVVSEIRKLCI